VADVFLERGRIRHERIFSNREKYSMNIFYRWAEAVRCSHCALVGIASLATDVQHSIAKIDCLPKGFKAVGTVNGDKIYCVACDRPARTLPIDP